MYPPAVQQFRYIAGLLGAIFGGVGLLFWLAPDHVLHIINGTGNLLHLPASPPSSEHFWGAMSVSMMAAITVCAWMIYWNPIANKNMVYPLITAKVVSSVAGIYYFIVDNPYFCHVLIAMTDLPIAIVLYVLYRRAFGRPSASASQGVSV